MCQLTLIAGKNISRFLSQLLYVNSLSNEDGHGIYSYRNKLYYKSELPFYNNTKEVSKFLDENESDIYLCHVRAASTLKNKISAEFSHPIVTKNYVFFHNGTYSGYYSSEKTDTMLFAEELDKEYTGNIIEDYKKVYKGGKFANLIVDRNTNKIYILRGDTAKLYKCLVKIGGEIVTIINTDINSLIHALNITNLTLFNWGRKERIELIKYDLLEKDTAYEFNPDTYELTKIGSIEEKVYTTVVTYTRDDYYTRSSQTYSNASDKAIVNRIKNLGLTAFEMDIILQAYNQKTLRNYINLSDIEPVVRILEAYYLRAHRKVWEKILHRSGMFVLDVYKQYNLAIPYFMNSLEELKNVLSAL